MGSCCKRSRVCSFLQAPVAFFGGDHPDHLKHIRFQAHGAHLSHHGGGNGLVAGKGTELVYLVFQQKGILAAPLQQGCGSALGQGGILRFGPLNQHHLQLIGLGFGELLDKAQLLAFSNQLLCPLAGLELAALQLEHAAQHHHGIFQAGKGAAQLVQILVAVGGGVKFGQHHHAPGAKEGDGARRHDELLDLGRGTIQHGGLLIRVSTQDPDGGRHRLPDKIPLAGIEIVDRTAAVCQLTQFGFRCHGGPLQKEYLISVPTGAGNVNAGGRRNNDRCLYRIPQT